MLFALSMVNQVAQGIRRLHSFGYSHSDLKLENICARIRSNGKFKFTLIDFGMVAKLPRIGENINKAKKRHRGNLMNASLDAI